MNNSCEICGSSTKIVKTVCGKYLFITFEESREQFFSHAVQKRFEFYDNIYVLGGIIGHDFKQGEEHLYSTFTRSKEDRWRKIDVLSKRTKVQPLTRISGVYIAADLFINVTT